MVKEGILRKSDKTRYITLSEQYDKRSYIT